MPKKRLRTQIYRSLALTFVLITAIFSVMLIPFEKQRHQTVIDKIELSLDTIVNQRTADLGGQIFLQNLEGLEMTVQRLMEFTGVLGIGVFTAEGHLLFAPSDVPPMVDLTPSELDAIGQTYTVVQARYADQPVVTYTKALIVIGETYGYVRIHYSLADVMQETRLAVLLFTAQLLTILFSMILLLNYALAHRVTAPLAKLMSAMQQFQAGKLGIAVTIHSDNEIEEIAQVFNAMSQENALMYRKLDESNRDLERKVAERTLELANAKEKALEAKEAAEVAQRASEAANRAKSVFLANMSHELRSPLNAILGFAQVISRSHTLPQEHQENLGIIRRSGEHLLTLINQVLDLSKIEAGRITLNPTTVDLHQLLRDVQEMFALPSETRGLQLLFEKHENVPQYIRTDDVKLRQVLINLLNNAIKFTEEGGVAVRILGFGPVQRQVEGFEILDFKDSDTVPQNQKSQIKNLKFEIEDSGPGIVPEEIDAVFEPFKQTEIGRQSQEGTGLGLPISRKFVQLMGGDMGVSSQIGHGTVFTFDIQCELADALDLHQATFTNQVIALEPGQRTPDGALIEDEPYRLLIVDDKPDNRKLLAALLSSVNSSPSGFDLREATNGQEAIDIWKAWKPHLIWMDMRMPVLDGYDATKQIRELETRNSKLGTRIIAVTASAYEEERAVVLSTGCDDFLRKPFKDTEIFEMLHTHLGVRFVYEEPGTETKSNQRSEERVTPEALTTLPFEWLADLQKGAEEAGIDRLSSVIAQIRGRDAALAAALTHLIEDFEYDQILALIEQCQGMIPNTGENSGEAKNS